MSKRMEPLHNTKEMVTAMANVVRGCTHGTNTSPHRNPVRGNKTRKAHKLGNIQDPGATRRATTQTKPMAGGRLKVHGCTHGGVGHRQRQNTHTPKSTLLKTLDIGWNILENQQVG
ncbi:hypothetical protein V2G26_019100 [Clonostachys chloroleuca]